MNNDYLMHYGILGMKWGVRRYQNEDGSLTNAGKKRYSNEQRIRDEKIYGKAAARRIEKRINRGEGIQSARHNEVVIKERKEKAKNIGKTIAKYAISAGATYAAYKIYSNSSLGAGRIPAGLVNLGADVLKKML